MVYFREEQKFDQWWIWMASIVSTLGITGLFGYALYQQLYLQEPWGDHPLPDLALIIVGLIAVIVSCIVCWFLLTSKLEMEVKKTHVSYKFFPFIPRWKDIEKEAIRKYEIRKYRAILEYGGWGYRRSFKGGKALTIRGNIGIELHLISGKRLLIGTQKPDQLRKVMKRLMSKGKENYG